MPMMPTVNALFHDSVKATRMGPSAAERQLLGNWCQPKNMFGRMFDQLFRPVPYNAGAPTVSVTVQVQPSPGQDDPQIVGQATRFQDWSDAFLRVDWGSGETDAPEMDVDLVNGFSFALIARQATFSLVYPINGPTLTTYQPLIDISISIGIGCNGSQGVSGAKRTIKVGTLAAGVPSAVFPIPKFSASANYASNDATAAATLIQTVSPSGGAQALAQDAVAKPESLRVPIVNGGRGFTLTTAGNSVGNAVVFYLSPA